MLHNDLSRFFAPLPHEYATKRAIEDIGNGDYTRKYMDHLHGILKRFSLYGKPRDKQSASKLIADIKTLYKA